ncbi:MAG: hypothetical protein WCS55_04680 [Sulfuricurvum sp.]|uniref:hypothetical protein n=1 Tax=Sulfuricurvum sp. TaxID=2025608 RepID=UPI003564AD4B
MSTFERIDGIIRQKRFEYQCMLKIEQMKSEENIRRLREARAVIEEKMKGVMVLWKLQNQRCA